MSRPRRAVSPRDIEKLLRWLLDLLGLGPRRSRRGSRIPRPTDLRSLFALIGVVALALIIAGVIQYVRTRPKLIPGSPAPVPSDGVLFCSWNVENFFDDRDDPANNDEDENWFGRDPDAFPRKVDALTRATLLHNDGRGPDVLAMVEVESTRCVEALRDSLNAQLPASWHYTGIVHRGDRTGRRFAPAILTRLAVREDLTRGPRDFSNRRILEAHLERDGTPLVVLSAHWTSRLRGEEATMGKREEYAKIMYARYLALRTRTPGLDVILAGDFNDEPIDPSLVEGLHAVDDRGQIRPGDPEPNLWDLVTAPELKGEGTFYLNGRWEFLDHIMAPPELLDAFGWTIRPETLEIGHFPLLRKGSSGAPWKFGGPTSTARRGYADHFALSVRLGLPTPPAPAASAAP